MAKKQRVKRDELTWLEWAEKLKTWQKVGIVAGLLLFCLVVYASNTIDPEKMEQMRKISMNGPP